MRTSRDKDGSGNEFFVRVNGSKVDAGLHAPILDNRTADLICQEQSVDFLMKSLGYSRADALAFYAVDN